MFIYSVKGKNIKLILSIAASVAVIVFAVLLIPLGQKDYVYPDDVLPAVKSMKSSDFKNVTDNEKRIEFLSRYGWTVESEPKEIIEIYIPKTFDSIYEKYNQMQIGEGLDLSKFKGKTAKRYTYVISNYEYEGTVLANLIIYKNQVIGGDISSADSEGFVHGFTKGNNFLT